MMECCEYYVNQLGHVITKISLMDRLPNFLSRYVPPLARAWNSAINSE